MSKDKYNKNSRDWKSSQSSVESIYHVRAARMFSVKGSKGLNLVRGKRSWDKVDRGIVFEIARMFFEDNEKVTSIAEKFGVSKGAIYMITSGKSHIKDWSDAVTHLIVSGVKCDRLQKPPKEKPPKKEKPGRLTVETVRKIRTLAKGGDGISEISLLMGISKPTIRNVVEFKNYTSKEYWV